MEIVNLTPDQQFTPFLLATHHTALRLFTLGTAASPQLQTLAEEGNVSPLRDALLASGQARDVVVGNGLTNAGKRATFTILASSLRGDRLSVAAMLIPTNDAFVSLQGGKLPLPLSGSVSYHLNAYDSGSENNDELCANIPGPNFAECGGPGGGGGPAGGEGFVHIHNGIHGIGNLNGARRDWRNPVAKLTIRLLP